MEYVNIHSLQTEHTTPFEIRNELLEKMEGMPDRSCIYATDDLEILGGQELITQASAQNLDILPLKRISHIRKTENFPKRVLLELTTNCNSLCTMCPRNMLERPMQHLPTATAKKVIKELADQTISGLWLYNIGESLMHPDIFDIIDYCRTFDTLGTLWLSTNGQILNDDLIDKLLGHPPDILNYSVNAMSEEHYKMIAPQLNFQTVQTNLQKLTAKKNALRKKRPLIRAQMIEIPHVCHEIEEFKRQIGPKVDIISINTLEKFSQGSSKKIPQTASFHKKIVQCNRLEREDFFVFSNGTVTCCDTDFNGLFGLGNVKEQTIGEIYHGKKYQALRQLYQEGRLHEHPLCSQCCDYDL